VLDKKISSTQAESWLKAIYDGCPRNMAQITTDYGEKISISGIFSERMKELALGDQPLFSDISFKTSDKKVAVGHRVILKANSGFFEALLDSVGEFQNFRGEVRLGLTLDDLNVIKDFLYGCPVSLTKKNVWHVFPIANQMIVDGLEQIAELFIRENIELFDPFEVFEFARRINANSLQEFCVWYLRVNYLDFQKSSKWKTLPGPTKTFIEENFWPGAEYIQKHAAWEKKFNELREKEGLRPKKENCILQ